MWAIVRKELLKSFHEGVEARRRPVCSRGRLQSVGDLVHDFFIGRREVLLQDILLVEVLQALLCTGDWYIDSDTERILAQVQLRACTPCHDLRQRSSSVKIARDECRTKRMCRQRTCSSADLDGLLGSVGALGLLGQARYQDVVQLLFQRAHPCRVLQQCRHIITKVSASAINGAHCNAACWHWSKVLRPCEALPSSTLMPAQQTWQSEELQGLSKTLTC